MRDDFGHWTNPFVHRGGGRAPDSMTDSEVPVNNSLSNPDSMDHDPIPMTLAGSKPLPFWRPYPLGLHTTRVAPAW